MTSLFSREHWKKLAADLFRVCGLGNRKSRGRDFKRAVGQRHRPEIELLESRVVPTYSFSSPHDLWVSESEGFVAITVSRTESSDAETVQFSTSDGTATAVADYSSVAIPLSFAIGESEKVVNIAIVNDGIVEGSETVNLAIIDDQKFGPPEVLAASILTIVDPPILTGPGYFQTLEDVPIYLTELQLVGADIGIIYTAIVQADSGNLQDDPVTFTGTVTTISNTLSTILFEPQPGYFGPVIVTVTISADTPVHWEENQTFWIYVNPADHPIAPTTLIAQSSPISIVQNTSAANQVVATFTSEWSQDTPQNLAATIDWGDGQLENGIIASVTGGFQVVAPSNSTVHGASGLYPPHVSIAGSEGRTAHTWTTLVIAKPASEPQPSSNLTAVAGVPFNTPVATLANASGIAYSFAVNWGDGSSVQTIESSSSISAAHTFADAGKYRIRIIPLAGGSSNAPIYADITVTSSAAPSPLNGDTAPVAGIWSTPFSGTQVAWFQDINPIHPDCCHSATINWGDGTAPTSSQLVNDPVRGGFKVLGDHKYAHGGSYLVTTSVKDSQGRVLVLRTTAIVEEQTPSFTPYSLNLVKNEAYAPMRLSDLHLPIPDSGDWMIVADWGNGGQSSALIVGSGSTRWVVGSPGYAHEGNYAVRLEARNSKTNAFISTSTYVHVAELAADRKYEPPLVGTPALTSASGNLSNARVALFDNTRYGYQLSNLTAEVYVQGVSEPILATVANGPNGVEIKVVAAHFDPGLNAIRVKLFASDHTFETWTTVAAPDPIFGSPGGVSTTQAPSFGATVGSPFLMQIATFVSTDIHTEASDWTASIDWGDGTVVSTASIDVAAMNIPTSITFGIGTGHSYAHAGVYWYRLVRTNVPSGNVTVAFGEFTVKPGDPSAPSTLATFHDSAPTNGSGIRSTFPIQWGDGAVTPGTSSGTTAVVSSGGHGYTGPGTFAVATTYLHAINTAISQRELQVGNAALIAGSAPSLVGLMGQTLPTAVVADFKDPSGVLTVGRLQAPLIDWGDGTTSTGSYAVTSTGDFQILGGGHTYLRAGTYAVLSLAQIASGPSLRLTNSASIGYANLSISAAAQNVGAFQNLPLDQGVFATFGASLDLAADEFRADIAWASGVVSTGTIVKLGANQFEVRATRVFAAVGQFPFTVQLHVIAAPSLDQNIAGQAVVFAAAAEAYEYRDDAFNAQDFSTPTASVAASTGALRLRHGLDFDLSSGTSIGGSPSLVYNSATVSPRPIVQFKMTPDAVTGVMPRTLSVRLTFDGVAQAAQIFDVDNGQGLAVQSFEVAVQAANAVTKSGDYAWSLDIEATYLVGAQTVKAKRTAAGTSYVAVATESPFGAGWGIDGVDRLVGVCGGVLWVQGDGLTRLFTVPSAPATLGDGDYTSPQEDFGHLKQLDDFTFDYTTKDQIHYFFDANGYLTKVKDSHNLERVYENDPQSHRLTSVQTYDGSTTAFNYDPVTHFLTTIVEPGNRTLTIGNIGGDVRTIDDVDGTTRTFTFGGHRLASDSWDPYSTTFGYRPAGSLQTVTYLAGNAYTLTAAAEAGLGNIVFSQLSGYSTWNDPTTGFTQVWLDHRGRTLASQSADALFGEKQLFVRNASGLVTSYKDQLNRETIYNYDGAGDLRFVNFADGGRVDYDYHAAFHKVTRESRKVTATTSLVTTYEYDGVTGDLKKITINPDVPDQKAIANYYWNGPGANAGLLDYAVDAEGNMSAYIYGANRRLASETIRNKPVGNNPVGDVARSAAYGYNAYGETLTRIDGMGNITTTIRDQKGRIKTQTVNGAANSNGANSANVPNDTVVATTSYLYSAAGFLKRTTDVFTGDFTENTIDAFGRTFLTQTIQAGVGAIASTVQEFTVGFNPRKVHSGNSRTEYTYDLVGRVKTEQVFSIAIGTFPETLARSRDTAYDIVGNVVLTRDLTETGSVFRSGEFTYDALNRLKTSKAKNAAGQILASSVNTFDLAGRVVSTLDAGSNISYFIRNLRGWVTTQDDYDATGFLYNHQTFGYDGNGNRSLTAQYSGDFTSRTFDALGNVLREEARAYDSANPTIGILSRLVVNHYNTAGQLDAVTNSRGTTQYVYNGLGQVSKTQVVDLTYGLAPNYVIFVQTTAVFPADRAVRTDAGDGTYSLTKSDAAGRTVYHQLVNANATDASRSTTEYNLGGQAVRIKRGVSDNPAILPDITEIVPDALGRPRQETTSRGTAIARKATYVYKRDGTQTLTHATGVSTTTADALGRGVASVDQNLPSAGGAIVASSATLFNLVGQVLQKVAGAFVSQFEYLQNGLTVNSKQFQNINELLVLGQKSSSIANLADRSTKSIDGVDNVSTQIADAAGATVSAQIAPPSAAAITASANEYNTDGWLTKAIGADGNYTLYEYDALGQVRRQQTYYRDVTTGATPALIEQVVYKFDLAAHQTRWDNLRGDYDRKTFDAAGKVTFEETGNQVGQGQASITSSITNTFDVWGNLSKSRDLLGNYTGLEYDAAGDVVRETVGNDLIAAGDPRAISRVLTKLYDLDGNLTNTTDRDGNFTAAAYDGAGRVVTETVGNASGTFTVHSFLYDLAGNKIRDTDASGNYTKWLTAYTGTGMTVTEEQCNYLGEVVRRTSSTFDLAGRLVRTVNGIGQWTVTGYDAAGRPTLSSSGIPDPNNSSIDVEQFHSTSALADFLGSETSTDADGNTWKRTKNTVGNVLKEVFIPAGQTTPTRVWSYQYDQAGNKTVTIDPAGHVTRRSFDSLGRVILQQTFDTINSTIPIVWSSTHYDVAGHADIATNGVGNYIRYEFDALGNVTAARHYSASNSLILQEKFEYSEGRQTAAIDGKGNIKKMTYAADGQLLTSTIAYGTSLAATTINHYNNRGLLDWTKDPDLNTTAYTYDAAGALETTTDQLGKISTSHHNFAGQLEYTIDRDLRRRNYTYDSHDHLVKEVWLGANNQVIETENYVYNARGLLASVSNNAGTTTMLSNALGQVFQVTQPSGIVLTFGYDLSGNRTSVSDTKGGLETSYYDAAHQLRRRQQSTTSWADFYYDSAGRVIATTRHQDTVAAGAVSSAPKVAGVVVNGDNQLLAGVERSMVDSVVLVFNQPVTLDAGAFTIAVHPNVTVGGGVAPSTTVPTISWSSGDGGISWTVVFSGAGVVGKSIADGVYDLTTIGSKVHAVAGTAVMSGNRIDTIYRLFGDSDGSYTPSGGVVGVDFQATISAADTNAFNAALNNTSGYTPVLDINADGKINSYDNLAFQGRDKTSWKWKAAQGTNLVAFTATRYDGADRIAEYLSGDGRGSELSDYKYVYDQAGNVTNEIRNGVSNTYAYNATNQLVAENATTYSYDLNGNRNSGGSVVGANNRLTTDGTWTYAYDDEGNVTGKTKASGEAWVYTYDVRNELTKAEHKATAAAAIDLRVAYAYDPWGNRIKKTVDPDGDTGAAAIQTIQFAIDGWNPAKRGMIGTENFDVWADLSSTGSLTTRYQRGDKIDELLSRVDVSGAAPGTYWYLTDRLGSIRAVVDTSGIVRDKITYDAFGNINTETGPSYRGRYAWTGREIEVETGLQYNRARWYDPKIGRWLSEDPLGFGAGDSNLYRYATNSPMNGGDSSGLDDDGPMDIGRIDIEIERLRKNPFSPPQAWSQSVDILLERKREAVAFQDFQKQLQSIEARLSQIIVDQQLAQSKSDALFRVEWLGSGTVIDQLPGFDYHNQRRKVHVVKNVNKDGDLAIVVGHPNGTINPAYLQRQDEDRGRVLDSLYHLRRVPLFASAPTPRPLVYASVNNVHVFPGDTSTDILAGMARAKYCNAEQDYYNLVQGMPLAGTACRIDLALVSYKQGNTSSGHEQLVLATISFGVDCATFAPVLLGGGASAAGASRNTGQIQIAFSVESGSAVRVVSREVLRDGTGGTLGSWMSRMRPGEFPGYVPRVVTDEFNFGLAGRIVPHETVIQRASAPHIAETRP